jgi:hypothetical protein
VGEAILAATVAIAAVTVVANIGLKALGGGSWADIGLAIAGLLTFGAAKVLGPAISAGVKSLSSTVRSADAAGDGAFVGADVVGAGNAAKSDAVANIKEAAGVRGAPGGNAAKAAPPSPASSAKVDPRANWTDPKTTHPGDYVPSKDAPPQVPGTHTSPASWLKGMNKMADPGRDNNCSECSRAVDNTWHGFPKMPAAMKDPYSPGEPVPRMEAWAGKSMTPSSMGDVGTRLQKLGSGSSAIVGAEWKGGGGHWFNAINDGGTIKALDGQSGLMEDWPPTKSGLGFDEGDMGYSDATFFGSDGKAAP